MKDVTAAPRGRRGLRTALLAGVLVLVWATFGPAQAFAAEPIQATTLQCQGKVNGNLQAFGSEDAGNVTDYDELDYVTCRFKLTADAAATGSLEVNFGSTNGSCDPFLSYFNLLTGATTGPAANGGKGEAAGANTQTYGNLTVTESGAISDEGNDLSQLLDVSFTGAGEQFVYFQLQFSSDAHNCSGSTIHVALGEETVNVGVASRDVPFPVEQFTVIQPVTLRSFTAARSGNAVTLRWRTGSEIDALGFNLYVQKNGKRVKLNRSLIASKGVLGGAYAFKARVPKAKKPIRFWLESVDLDGTRTFRSVLLR